MPVVHLIIVSNIGLSITSKYIFSYLFIISFKVFNKVLDNVCLVGFEM